MTTLILLCSCVRASNRMSSSTNVRIDQYKKGLELFFSYYEWFVEHNMDILITDNSCTNYLDELKSYIPDSIKYRCLENNKGTINKGSGVIGQWSDCIDIIKEYDYIIHFEPRQLLQGINFFQEFIDCKMSQFTINPVSNTFNTGLFAIESNLLLSYIETCDLKYFDNNFICIENHLYDFMKDKEYKIVDKMNVIWIDGNNEHHM